MRISGHESVTIVFQVHEVLLSIMKTLCVGFGGLNPPEGRREALGAPCANQLPSPLGFRGVLQPHQEYSGKLVPQHAHSQTQEA
jgi:hypothetical protein